MPRALRRAVVAAGIDTESARWGAHAFRHHWTTRMLLGGAPVQVVAKLAGHSDGGALVMRTYSHVFDILKRDDKLHSVAEAAVGGGAL